MGRGTGPSTGICGTRNQLINGRSSPMQLNPYLTFNGQCEAAFKFYEKCLGGKIEMMMAHKDSPVADQVPPAWRDKIMHARMTLGGEVLMGSDGLPDRHEQIKGCSVSLSVDTPGAAERIFKEL